MYFAAFDPLNVLSGVTDNFSHRYLCEIHLKEASFPLLLQEMCVFLIEVNWRFSQGKVKALDWINRITF